MTAGGENDLQLAGFLDKLGLAKLDMESVMSSVTVNMHQAKSTLSKLVEGIESGAESEIILARNGKPVARIVPLEPIKKQGVKLGIAAGLYPNFDFDGFQALDAEVKDMFFQSGIEPK
ncbi:MAG: type II toxin-antitoxin system Phd/YefM family antitoxin [Beijerinckiaceae bacterium]